MPVSLKELSGYSVHLKDRELGKIEQFYFDDEKWTIRYVIVATGSWFSRSKVLISPLSIQNIDYSNRRIMTNLTQDQLLKSPDIDTEKPISRQMETQYLDYYRWPYYWTGAGVWGTGATLEGFGLPPSFKYDTVDPGTMPKNEDEGELHLRSTKEVFGYQVDATDVEFGRIDDFIVDESNWVVRYLVIHLRKWLPSKDVLISRDWVESISFRQKKVRVSLSQHDIKESPEFDPGVPLSRDYEDLLHKHYGREKYWEKKRSKSAA